MICPDGHCPLLLLKQEVKQPTERSLIRWLLELSVFVSGPFLCHVKQEPMSGSRLSIAGIELVPIVSGANTESIEICELTPIPG